MRVGISRRARPQKILVFIAVLTSIIFSFAFFINRAAPIFEKRAADTAAQTTRKIVSDVAGEVFSTYSDNFTENKSSDDMSIISIDVVELNKLRASFTSKLIEELSNTNTAEIFISVGSLFNSETLQGVGFKVPVKINFGSISDVDFEDEFVSAGINQTKHLVSLKVSVTAAVISAFMCETRDVEVSLPLSESIIVGKVPQYYSDRMNVAAKGE